MSSKKVDAAWRKERAEAARKFNEFLMSLPEPTQEQNAKMEKICRAITSKAAMKRGQELLGQ